jgi:hypothetical protein
MRLLRALLLLLVLGGVGFGSMPVAAEGGMTCMPCAAGAQHDCSTGTSGVCAMGTAGCMLPAIAPAAAAELGEAAHAGLIAATTAPFDSLALAPGKAPPRRSA